MEYSLPKYTNCGYYRIFFHLHDYLLIMRDSRKENDILYEKWCKYTQDLCILRFVNSNKKKHKKINSINVIYAEVVRSKVTDVCNLLRKASKNKTD